MRGFVLMTAAVFVAVAIGVGVESATTLSSAATWTITPRQPTIRLTVAQPCPQTIARVRDVTNPTAQASVSLVPPNPTAALICRYGMVPSSTSSAPAALESRARVNGLEARELVAAIDRLSTTRPAGAASCPAAFAAATIIALSYATGADADLWYQDTGCQTLDNGFIESSEIDDPAFFDGFIPLVDRLAPRR